MRLAEAQRELDRAVQNLIKGRLSDEEADAVLPALRADRDRLRIELSGCESVPNIIALHPAALTQYQATIDRLSETMAEHTRAEDDRGNLVRDFRALINSVVVHRRAGKKDLYVEVKGKLAALIGGNAFPDKVGGRVVAEEGYEAPATQTNDNNGLAGPNKS